MMTRRHLFTRLSGPLSEFSCSLPIYDTLTYFWGVRLSLVSMLKYPSIASRPPDEVPFWEPGYQLSQLGLIFFRLLFAEDPSGALSSYRFHIPGGLGPAYIRLSFRLLRTRLDFRIS